MRHWHGDRGGVTEEQVQQEAAEAQTSTSRVDEEVFEPEPATTQERRIVVEEERESGGFVARPGDQHFGGRPGTEQRTGEIVRRVKDAQPLLAAVGVAQPDELMTNNRLYQRLDRPDHSQYLLFQSSGDEPLPVAAFLQRIQGAQQPDFLLFDWTSHAIRTIAVEPSG